MIDGPYSKFIARYGKFADDVYNVFNKPTNIDG